MLDRIVELIKPAINTNASGKIWEFGFNAKGINPPMAVSDVKTTGKNRISLPFSIASSSGNLSSRNYW